MTFIEAEIYHLIVHHPYMDDSCLASQERVKHVHSPNTNKKYLGKEWR